MVEAAGVEPASENVTGQETTYLVAFRFRRNGNFRSPRRECDKKRRPLVRISRLRGPDPAAVASPQYDVLSRPVDEAKQNGYLQIRQRMPFLDWQLSCCARLRMHALRYAS